MTPYSKKLILLLFFSYSSLCLLAQTTFVYSPLKNDSILLDNIKKDIRQRYVKDSLAISGENKKELIKIYKERYDYVNEMFRHKEMIGSPECNAYLNSIVNEIIKNNPELQSLGSRFLFSRAYWPNAFSVGEGTIVFNIGLFARLDNESQAVFTLCHELAHLYLDHGNKAIHQYVTMVNSKEFQQKLKEIKRSSYEQNRQLAQLEKGLVFRSRRHGREHESEADSMGLVFMQRTRFDCKESVTLLDLLDNIDKEHYDVEKGLPQIFNFPEHPFQNRWIKKETSFFGVSADTKETEREEDSLKTHPDCKARIKRLTPYVEKSGNGTAKKFVVSKEQFDTLKREFQFEIVDFCYQINYVSRSLYHAMELFKANPNDAYLAGMIGNCLNGLYSNQKKHTLDKIVDRPSPYVEKNYNNLLEFIQNVSLADFSTISYYFLKQYETSFAGNKTFADAYAESKKNYIAQ